jgi:deoxyribodipyrimidine photo-lyase
MSSTLVWFRHDLRLTDNPALSAAAKRGGPVIPIFVWAPEEEEPWPPGGASRWWLHRSLTALDAELKSVGSRLVVRRGPTHETLHALSNVAGATAVFWNRRYEPAIISRDRQIKESLRTAGLEVESFNASLLREPWTIQNKSGKPFQVFTPFWRHCLSLLDPARPLPSPQRIPPPDKWPDGLTLKELELEPMIPWAEGIRVAWQPGTRGAVERLKRFLAHAFADYQSDRNRPDAEGTSRLSPHLHFGEVSPRQVWHALRSLAAKRDWSEKDWRHSQFLAELGWREFSHHLLFHFPHTPLEPLRPEFARFPWQRNEDTLAAWQRGRTGFPLVDAGMRELWTTGWMHNRVRMVVASFLVKDLLIHWQEGARWFWDTLVDADLAQNTLGWQWTAGCGADAAPFFRVFNPNGQGEKFDPSGDYVRKWCPELRKLPAEWIHRPHEAAPGILRTAGVSLGTNFPKPIVSHSIARNVALEAYTRIRCG